MKRNLKTLMKQYGQTAWRVIVFLLLCANLWLQQNYVTRKEYEEGRKAYERDMKENTLAHLGIQSTVNDIATAMKLMAANQVRTEDHETRIRTMESKESDIIARLNVLERLIK